MNRDPLRTYDRIWRAHSFKNVRAVYRDLNGKDQEHAIDGYCFSEYKSGPNLLHLADHVAAAHPEIRPIFVGLKSADYVGWGFDPRESEVTP